MVDEPNQGATGPAPAEAAAGAYAEGESPLSVDSHEDPYAERPELFVGGAFLGGLVLAQVLRRLGNR